MTTPTRKRRNDVIFIAVLLAVAILLGVGMYFLRGERDSVTVTVDGNLYGTYPLSVDTTVEIRTAYGYNRLVIQNGEANIVALEKKTEMQEREVAITEKKLDAEVRKRAEANKFAAQQEAEAMKAKADAAKYAALAEAEGIAAVGKAEAEAIQAKALAEAEGIDKKAEAQRKMGEASVMEMYFDALPKVVANASAPLTNVDKITLYGEGNQAKLVGDVMKSADQIMSALTESTGVDIKSAVAGFLGGKAAK
jgi:flotillin